MELALRALLFEALWKKLSLAIDDSFDWIKNKFLCFCYLTAKKNLEARSIILFPFPPNTGKFFLFSFVGPLCIPIPQPVASFLEKQLYSGLHHQNCIMILPLLN